MMVVCVCMMQAEHVWEKRRRLLLPCCRVSWELAYRQYSSSCTKQLYYVLINSQRQMRVLYFTAVSQYKNTHTYTAQTLVCLTRIRIQICWVELFIPGRSSRVHLTWKLRVNAPEHGETRGYSDHPYRLYQDCPNFGPFASRFFNPM